MISTVYRQSARFSLTRVFASIRPYSTPSQPTPQPASAQTPSTPVSSCPAGTVLKNLNINKSQDPILALEDSEYPPWLWTVLEPKEVQEKKLWETDPNKAAKKMRRKENRKAIKEANFLASMSK